MKTKTIWSWVLDKTKTLKICYTNKQILLYTNKLLVKSLEQFRIFTYKKKKIIILCSLRLQLFDHKFSKNSNIVNSYYNFKSETVIHYPSKVKGKNDYKKTINTFILQGSNKLIKNESKDFLMLQNIYILDKWSSFELSIDQRILKKTFNDFLKNMNQKKQFSTLIRRTFVNN